MWVVSTRLDKSVYHDSRCRYVQRIYKRNRKALSEQELLNARYKPCKYCNGIHFFINLYKAEIEKFCSNNNYEYDVIKHQLFIRTNISCWKIVYLKREGVFVLYHRNHTKRHIKRSEIFKCGYHLQKDVSEKKMIQEFFDYIRKHDTFRTDEYKDYKKLPRDTKQQKEYYNKAKKKNRRKGIRTVDRLFAEIERKDASMKKWSIG